MPRGRGKLVVKSRVGFVWPYAEFCAPIVRRDGQYIGTIPTMQSNIPNSDSKFGKKSAIHEGEIAGQSIIDGWPITKYP